VSFFFKGYTKSDGIDYHNIAVNIVHGKGYSKEIREPYRLYFFREPMYPFFLAAIYSVWSILGESTYLDNNFYRQSDHPEIVLAKYFQSILGAVTCVIFYLTIMLFLNKRVSLIIGVLFSAYIPLAVYSTQIMRESLQTFLVVFLNYCFARFLLSKRIEWIILSSILVGTLNLTLQITILLPVLMFGFIFIHFRSLEQSLKYFFFSTLIIIAVVFPWIIRAYTFYPDIRVAKTLGISLTYEANRYMLALRTLRENNLISEDSLNNMLHKEIYDIDEHEKFRRSFTGYYRIEADTISKRLNEPLISRRKIEKAIHNFRRSWIESLWVIGKDGRLHERPHQVYVASGKYFMFFLSLTGLVFGYMAIPGMLLFFKRLFPAMLCFTYFIPLFYFIGDEPRRMLPVHAYIFLFSCLGIYCFYLALVRKYSPSRVFDLLEIK